MDKKHRAGRNKKKNVAIIVLHFGDKKNTLECLQSLSKLTYTRREIILVDNGTNSFAASTRLYTLIRSKKNLGYAGGNNLGVRYALKKKNDFILILNNDTVVKPGIIEKLLEPFSDPRVGITGPLITYAHDPQRIWFAGGSINPTFCFTRHPGMDMSVQDAPQSGPVDFITGACFMVKREVFDAIGLLSEEYFLYWEDVDFCTRARSHGFLCYYDSKPLVNHKVSAATGIKGENKLSPLRAYYYARNTFMFMRKNQYPFIGGTIGQLFIRLPYNFLQLQDYRAAKSYIKGLRDGLLLLFKQ